MRIGTRRSALALAQAEAVAALLGGAEIVEIATSGDRGAGVQDKSRWVRELEHALLEGSVDIAVHSAKDVPVELPDGLEILAVPPRARAEDVLCGAQALEQLPSGARVGTSSLRRAAQLRAQRPDLEPVALRGNVDTRLRKLAQGDAGVSAIVLAAAGLERLGRSQEAGGTLDPARFVPAPGQGALALEGRSGDARTAEAAAALDDGGAFACLAAERALARELRADCHTPLGAHARAETGTLRMRAWVGLPDGATWIADELVGDAAQPEALGGALARRMLAVGAAELLARSQEMAAVAGR